MGFFTQMSKTNIFYWDFFTQPLSGRKKFWDRITPVRILFTLFVCKSWIIILNHMNNSTFCKSKFNQEILHNFIISLCIYSHMFALFKCPVETKFPDSFFRAIPDKSMNNTILTIVNPFTV